MLAVAGLLLPLASSLNAAFADTTYDFTSGAGSIADFTTSPSSNWAWSSNTLTPGATPMGPGFAFASTSSSAVSGTALTTVAGVGSSFQDFEVSTSFQLGNVSGGSASSWGMALLGDSTSSLSKYILVDYSSTGTFRVLNLQSGGNGGVVSVSDTFAFNFDLDTTYTLTATGTYVGSMLTISVDLTDGSNTGSITATAFDASATGYTGDVLGLRARSGSGTTVQYESLSVAAIPEPSAFALFIGMGVVGFVAARRRR
jgi:PEP-CTERM putative exosortase interaction domain